MNDDTINPWFELAKISDLVPPKFSLSPQYKRQYLGKDITQVRVVVNDNVLLAGYADGCPIYSVPIGYTFYIQQLNIVAVDNVGQNQFLLLGEGGTEGFWGGWIVQNVKPDPIWLSLSMTYPEPYIEYPESTALRLSTSANGAIHFTLSMVGFLLANQQSQEEKSA